MIHNNGLFIFYFMDTWIISFHLIELNRLTPVNSCFFSTILAFYHLIWMRLWGPLIRVEIKMLTLFSFLHFVLISLLNQSKSQKELGSVCLFSVCEQLSASGVDVMFQTAHQCVYVLGARKFFPNKHSLIQLGWADLSTD